MARLIVRSKDEKAGNDYADRLAAAFRVELDRRKAANEPTLRLLGPAEAPVFRLKGYFRFHFQIAQRQLGGVAPGAARGAADACACRRAWS